MEEKYTVTFKMVNGEVINKTIEDAYGKILSELTDEKWYKADDLFVNMDNVVSFKIMEHSEGSPLRTFE